MTFSRKAAPPLLNNSLEIILIDYVIRAFFLCTVCYQHLMLAYSRRFSYPDSWTGNHPTQTQRSGHSTSAASLLTHPPTERLVVEPCSWGVSIMPCCMLASMYGGITVASSLLQWHHSLKRAALKGSSCSLQHISDIAAWPNASLLTSVAAPHSPDANAIHLHLHEALLQHARGA